jgi:hypothetical protein
MTIHTITVLFSSDPLNGALNINSNTIYQGNKFSVDLSRYPISIPRNARSCTISVIGASIPYISPNIIADVNSEFYFLYNAVNYQISFPTGLYSLSSIQSTLQLGLNNLSLPSDLFSFVGNGSTQKVSIVFNYANSQIDFTQSDTFRFLLGFNSGVYPPGLSVVAQSITAQNVAELDTLQSYTILTDLVTAGIPINNVSRNVIAAIPINTSPGGRIIYDPQNASIVNCSELIGSPRTNCIITIANQRADDINMLNQPWSVTIKIVYEV